MAPRLRRFPNFPVGAHAVIWGVLLLLIAGLFAISRHFDGRNVWQAWSEGRELRQPNYAERIYHAAVFRTRANTWSNLAYVVVGLYACAVGWRDRRGRPSTDAGYVPETPALSFFFGISCCYLGVGSGLYHASLTRWGQQLDVASMYAPLLAALVMQIGRMIRGRWPNRVVWPWLLLAALVANVLLYRFKWSMSSTVVLATLIFLQVAGGVRDLVVARKQMRVRWQAGALAALLAAIACRQLDVAGKFSGPDTWLQGHACWHLLTALSLASVYAYQRDEMPVQTGR